MTLPPFVYSPFLRGLDDLDASDLNQLRNAAEGWHVDYKRELPTIDSAGKSMSSFANMFGGWIFYGIDAPGSGSPYPTGFPGIEDGQNSRLLEVLQRAASQVTPPPFFATKTMTGPDVPTGLPAGRSIVAVRVPPGAHAPYIHNNGRIYRRVADSSEPRHETDRHVLDLLWQRSNDAHNRWAKIVSQEFAVSEAEREQPRMHIFLSCDPYGDRGTHFNLEFDDFVTRMREVSLDSGGLPFDNFFSGEGNYIARQIGANDPHQLLFTWRQHFDGTAIITYPITKYEFNDARGALVEFQKYKHGAALKDACTKIAMDHGRILDLNNIPHLLTEVLQRYRQLLKASNIQADFFAKVRIDNIWRAIPFIDLHDYAEFLRKYGLPLIQPNDAFAPPGIDEMYRLRCWQDGIPERLEDSLTLFTCVSTALGVWLMPSSILGDYAGLLERAQTDT